MDKVRLSSFIVQAAVGAVWLLGSAAQAQSVRLFDDAPSLQQLREIMLPEVPAGTARSIVLMRPDAAAVRSAPVQTAAAHDTVMPEKARPTAARSDPGVVGFHINFAFDSAILPEPAQGMIDRIAQLMKENPPLRLRVEGHTDAVGPVDYNLSLSERRALSVGRYPVAQGIDPSRLQLVGKGMAEPVTEDPRDAANRRVQFVRVN
jgi:outer membrane protein OmpA-like peptidoglycan-associated protein